MTSILRAMEKGKAGYSDSAFIQDLPKAVADPRETEQEICRAFVQKVRDGHAPEHRPQRSSSLAQGEMGSEGASWCGEKLGRRNYSFFIPDCHRGNFVGSLGIAYGLAGSLQRRNQDAVRGGLSITPVRRGCSMRRTPFCVPHRSVDRSRIEIVTLREGPKRKLNSTRSQAPVAWMGAALRHRGFGKPAGRYWSESCPPTH